MESITRLLDKLPFSRSFLLVLGLIALIAYQIIRSDPDAVAEKQIGRWQGEIDQRKATVEQSIASLQVSDKGLLNCLRNAAEDRANIHPQSTGGIDDVRELELLFCPRNDIKALTGIGEMASLRFIDLSDNSIQSITPLRNHPSVRSLNLTDNPLKGIQVVKSLPALRELYLPDMPDLPCLDIARMVEGMKSNYKSMRCEGSRSEAREVNKVRDVHDPGKLTEAQQRELLEFEREMRYQK